MENRRREFRRGFNRSKSNFSYPSRYGRPNRSRFGGNKKRGEHIDESRYIRKALNTRSAETFVPSFKYEDLKVDKILKENIFHKGFTSFTPIQDQVIPLIMNGNDVLGMANTGTGKTAAFLIPLIQKVLLNRSEKVLIIAPTRELAAQINEDLYALTRNLRVFSVECTGGNSIFKQINAIRKGYSFIVGTPGRLLDLYKRQAIDYSRFSNIVLDEVDRMLDMGFVNDIKEIISHLSEKRQSLFFSATIDRKVEDLIHLILKKDYSKVSVITGLAADNIEQSVVKYKDKNDKTKKLVDILKSESTAKTLVFVNTKRYVDTLERELDNLGLNVCTIHGDKRQHQRKKAIDLFKSNRTNVLIATDVAARGLDISGISHVINFDEPNTFDDYIHRIGRTGRASNSGIAITFVKGQ